jgi:hypothetical protein
MIPIGENPYWCKCGAVRLAIFLNICYSYLTATRIESMENMEIIDIYTPTYGTG